MKNTNQTENMTLEKIEAEFNEYRNFKKGWADGVGTVTPPEQIDRIIELCKKYYPTDLPFPLICPMIDGSFDFEWRLDDVSIHLEIEDDLNLSQIAIFDKIKLRQQRADKTIKRIDTNSCFTRINADITTPEGWNTLNKTVSKFLQAEQLAS